LSAPNIYPISARRGIISGMSKAALREKWKAAGICPNCGCRPCVDGMGYCSVCRDKCYEKYKLRTTHARQEGRCAGCDAELSDGRSAYCDDCRVYSKIWWRSARREWKEQGRCSRCGGVRENRDFIACVKCRAKRAQDGKTPASKARVRRRSVRLLNNVLAHYGARCVCCGEEEHGFLTIDHIENGGSVHRRTLKASGARWYRWIQKNDYPAFLQILCFNCNCAKGRLGECPHETKRKSQEAA
jgi:hypothetical protein